MLGVAGGLTLFGGIGSYNSVAPTWNSVVAIALGVCGLVGAAVLVASAFNRRLWRRRSPEAQAEAERWEAFRRYLTDFPRLDIAPAASLELWERYLVYGIAFGIAERVLQGAQLHMPEALATASTLYWIGPHGDLASGADVDEHRRPRVRLRLGARSPLVRLRRLRRRLLGRRRRRRRRWRRRRLVRPWLLAAVAIFVAGCGGGDEEQAAARRRSRPARPPPPAPVAPACTSSRSATANRPGCT